MKAVLKYVLFVLLFLIAITSLRPTITFASTQEATPEIRITEWQIHPGTDDDSKAPPAEGWLTVKEKEQAPALPKGTSSLWVKIELPAISNSQAGLLVDKAYAQNVFAYVEGKSIYETTRDRKSVV